jgi:phosphoenolpyruvate---glycerone phosphotransferase subunit DhaL
MKTSFSNLDGEIIVRNMIKVIQENKQYLSDIDGAIGDGDHGINMNKGFTLCEDKLNESPVDLSEAFRTLSTVLMMKIGGSMGPLYGTLFKAMSKASEDKEKIDKQIVADMLFSALSDLRKISDAQPGDKTLIDCLVPAEQAIRDSITVGDSFNVALTNMKKAAEKGKDLTKDMIAKKGRSSRLGERSRGTVDAGATSCFLLLESLADSILVLID